jgi:hypothetical protein
VARGSLRHDHRVVRRITITLDERVATWACDQAAKRGQSLSRFVSDLMRARMHHGEAYEAARQAFLDERPTGLKRKGPYPNRASLHDRFGRR